MGTLLIFFLLGLYFLISLAVITYATFGVEKAPTLLRPLLRHIGRALDALDKLMEEEREAQQVQPPPSPAEPAVAPVDAESEIFNQSATFSIQTRQNANEVRFFQLQEMAIACKFEPHIENDELQVTSRELSRLNNYCALAFEKPLSVSEFLTPLGLKVRKVRSRK